MSNSEEHWHWGETMNRLWKRLAPLFLCFGLVFGMFATSAISGEGSLFMPLHAEETDIYVDPNLDGDVDRPTVYAEDEDSEYDKDGKLENLVIGLYSVKIKLFGIEIDFSNLAKSLNNFLSFDKMKRISIESGSSGFNLYNFFRDTVWGLTKGMGVTLLTLMMMWKFIKECFEVERFSWERALMILAKTFFYNMFIAYSFDILALFFEWVMDFMNAIINVGGGTGSAAESIRSLGEVFAVAITDSSWIEKALILIIALLMCFTYYGTIVGAVGEVIVFYVKALAGMAFSPIAMGISVDESHGTDVMRYIFWMTGVFLQAPLIKVGLSVYNLLLNELVANNGGELSIIHDPGGFVSFFVGVSLVNGLLTMFIHMAQQVTDRVLPG